MIAQVIVDIPAAQVNRPFDYLVPIEWENILTIGTRVKVPFGPRQLLGFVVGFKGETDYEGPLKEIAQLLDYYPFLNPELISLSEYLTDHLQAFQISILQTMLPALLKVKYETYVTVHRDQDLIDLGVELNGQPLLKTELEEQLKPSLISQLIEKEIIEFDYRVLDRKSHKKELFVRCLLTKDKLEEERSGLRSTSIKLLALLEYFIDETNPDSISIKELSEKLGVTSTHIKKAQDKGWIEIKEREILVNPLASKKINPTKKRDLNPSQRSAFNLVKDAMGSVEATTFLLQGVTGSGKTEVYLQLMEEAINQGKTALLLVPEISLTPQMVDRVLGRFGQGVAVLHSGLSNREKFDEWQRIIKGQAKVVVGARSSIFAPLTNIGLIIIDEEHESTYKQGDNPRYHARDVALWRSQYHHCPLVLGSATPSLESRARAQVGRYHLLLMNQRANLSQLPPVEIIDMTQILGRHSNGEISPQLLCAIEDRIDKKEQVVLLLNRRGFSSYIQCRECGHVVMCPRCDISLTYHKPDNCLKCHYCDYQESLTETCPLCHSSHLKFSGSGTQKIQEELECLLPGVRILRMDIDTTRRKGDHEKILNQFGRGQGQILLGTQMIAKGLDFEKVTLVGVINADTSLNLPDFRSAEKTFQLLTQVSGRAGRGAYAGEVLIQTYNPDHYVLKFAQKHAYDAFFNYEMKRRKLGAYPPYYLTTMISVSSKSQAKAELTIHQIKNYLQTIGNKNHLIILGPSQSPIAKIKDHYYYQVLLKYKNRTMLDSYIQEVVQQSQDMVRQGLFISIDHEPLSFI